MFKRLRNRLGRVALAMTAAAALAGMAHAAPANNADMLASAFGGQMDGIEVMSETEMADTRGGYRGFSFGLFISGDITNLGNTSGEAPDGVDIVSQGPDNVSLSVGLAGLPNTGGLIQFANINGNNNVINNTMILNIIIVEDGSADTSSYLDGSFLMGG